MAYHVWSRNTLILDLLTVADNLHTYFTLPHTALLRLSGADAEAFAQSQFANDVMALEPGQWQWSCWLTAKGRVQAVFALLRQAPGELLLVLPDGGALELGQALARFVFRRKVALAVDTAAVCGQLAAHPAAAGSRAAIGDDGVIALDWSSDGGARTLWIGRAGDQDDDGGWRQADLRAGLPRLDASQQETWTPQQLGLDRLGGYSVRKGCYPGQEIVARTHFLGKAKRATQVIDGLAAGAAPGDAVQHGDATLGQLACVAGPVALAVMPLEPVEGPLTVNGHPVHAGEPETGLRR